MAHKGLARAGAQRQLGPLNSKNGGTRRRRQFSSHVNASPETGNKGQTGKSDQSKEVKNYPGQGQMDGIFDKGKNDEGALGEVQSKKARPVVVIW